LAKRTDRPVGFSDHTTSVETGRIAAAAGAVILEKHFTLDRTQAGPDHSFSLEPAQLAEYIAHVRATEEVLGRGELHLHASEQEVRTLARSSVVAAVMIPRGTRITAGMLTVKRPGTGIAPANLINVSGRIALGDIPADTPMTWEMVQ
jgi:sialic acid synthase SpsE